MGDGRWDASGDGRPPWGESGAPRDAGSRSGLTSGSSPFASSGPFADSPFDVSTEDSPYLGDDGGGSSPVATSAPVVWLWLASVAAAGGLLLAVLTDHFALHVVGWIFAGPVALSLLALFSLRDTARRANPWYVVNEMAAWLYRLAIVTALVGVVACALRIALYVGRL